VHSGLDRSLVERPRACRDLVLVTAHAVCAAPRWGRVAWRRRCLATATLGDGVLEMVMVVYSYGVACYSGVATTLNQTHNKLCISNLTVDKPDSA